MLTVMLGSLQYLQQVRVDVFQDIKTDASTQGSRKTNSQILF